MSPLYEIIDIYYVTHDESTRALVAFHYGNLTNPSQDPPRIGLLSTVPSNDQELLKQAVDAAAHDGGNFPGE